MKNLWSFWIFTILLGACNSQADYTPSEILDLVKSGKARQHGACFANQGAGCLTYLWKKSDDQHVFFFLRDGDSYGEFREELLSQGRFIEIFEKYLALETRKSDLLKTADKLRFVNRKEKLLWKDNIWYGSEVLWSFTTKKINGEEVQEGDDFLQLLERGVVSVVFPDEHRPQRDFAASLERTNLTKFERAFGEIQSVIEIFGPTNNRCSIWAVWPKSDPTMSIVLQETIPTDRQDSFPFSHRLKERGRMPVNLGEPRNTPYIFKPIQQSREPQNAER